MTSGKMLSYVEIDVPYYYQTMFSNVQNHGANTVLGWTRTGSGSMQALTDDDFPNAKGVLITGGGANGAWTVDETPDLLDTSILVQLKWETGYGTSQTISVISRFTDIDNFYRCTLNQAGQFVVRGQIAGVDTVFGSVQLTHPFIPSDGDLFWLRFEALETGGALLRAKIWQGNPEDEPQDWMVSGEDAVYPLPAGRVGFFLFSGLISYGFFSVMDTALLDTNRFAINTGYLPTNIEAVPSVRSINYSAAKVSLGVDLGRRASVNVQFRDHPHQFGDEPFDQGTFWGKWRARYGTKIRGRPFRFIQGFLGQELASMETRHFVAEAVNGPTPDGQYTISAKDPLKFLDDERAQAPRLSNGRLVAGIDNDDTAATLTPTGIGDQEYPTSGLVCIGGKEVVEFTRSGDALTITRAQHGTEARTHATGDRVQLVLQYEGDSAADIAFDLITNYTDFDPAFIPLTDWQTDVAINLQVLYARVITEPTGVNKLLSELTEQAAIAMAWDDRASVLRLQVLKEISVDAQAIEEAQIVEGSLRVSDQPDQRISQMWTYYGQQDPTDRGDNADNYRAALATVDLERESDYGGPEIRKLFGNWIPTEGAAERLNQIKLSRFRDPPREFAFDLFQGDFVQILGGYRLVWRQNQNILGLPIGVGAPIQITSISVEPGLIHVEAEEMLAIGVINVTNIVILTDVGSLLSWEVPDTWNDSNNSIHTIGGGGGGGGGTNSGGGGGGGGGGGYSKITNLNLTPGALVSYRIGAPGVGVPFAAGTNGEDTWFNGANLAASSVGSKGGTGGTPGNIRTSVDGGQASSGVGTTRKSGGQGGRGATKGEERAGGGGGGGAGGPNGDGGAGKALSTSSSQDGGGGGGAGNGGASALQYHNTDGGDGGNNRFGFGGGTAQHPNGQEGGGGKGGRSKTVGTTGDGGDGEQLWTQTIAPIISAGPGGGGGGGGSHYDPGGEGGAYGGGGGGGGLTQVGGNGGQGCVVIVWSESGESIEPPPPEISIEDFSLLTVTNLGANPSVPDPANLGGITVAQAGLLVLAFTLSAAHNAQRSVDSITVNGIAATIHTQGQSGVGGTLNNVTAGIASISVGAGATGDIVIGTAGGSPPNCSALAVHPIVIRNLDNTTPHHSNSNGNTGSSSVSTTIDRPAGGIQIVVAAAQEAGSSPGAQTPTGFTETIDTHVDSDDGDHRHQSGHDLEIGVATGATVSGSGGSTGLPRRAIAAATWL